MPDPKSPFPDASHSHEHCIASARERFEADARSTHKRPGVHVQDVLEVLLSQHRAFGAYEIAAHLAKSGKKLQAVQIYRALDALIEAGSVHRIESRNAFIACHNGEECSSPQFLICESCERVAEIDSKQIEASVADAASTYQFQLHSRQVELSGLCTDCSSQISNS